MNKTKDNFVGTWKGTDHGTLDPSEINYWVVTRTKDGAFFVDFTTYFKDGTIEKSSEKGLWFVEGNLYYEQRDGENQADVYTFVFESLKTILFKDTVSSYKFTDTKILLN